ncbi:hypothetical protein NGRA_3087 [Nosema granulosis]|uniref:Uncharacterized protein n=1 Tax=Nosema granulosis TaxID=83296 RepID=A0A9P6KX35_9MICR|nr:hypothetical protein NGRA_3087 [Nosema granulosis]
MIKYNGYIYVSDWISKIKGNVWWFIERKTCTGKPCTNSFDKVLFKVKHFNFLNIDNLIRMEVLKEIKRDAIATNGPSKDIIVRALKDKNFTQWNGLQSIKHLVT